MKKETRVEYLYPNINNERKYKWLENAEFIHGILDYDIIKYSQKEYLKATNQENDQYVSDTTKNITEEINQKNYEIWKSHGQKIWNFNPTNIRWNNEIIEALATYLSKNPLTLPHFIEHNAADIISHLIGETSNIIFCSEKRASQYTTKIWKNPRINKQSYRTNNFYAKYNLSLFLATINKLLDLGINLDEFYFGNLREYNTYHKLKTSTAWNENLLENLKEEDYIRQDGYHFTKEEMKKNISYENLHEFLERVMDLVETEYYIEFIEEPITMDINHIVPFMGYGKEDMAYYKETGTQEIRLLCKEIQEKLKKVREDTENIWIARNKQEAQKQSEIDAWQETDSGKEKLRLRIGELEDKLEKKEQEVKELKNQLQKYIQEGGKNPLKQETNVSKKEVVKIISEIEAKTFKEKLRKHSLLGFLLGIAFTAGCMLISTPYRFNKEKGPKQIVEMEESLEEEEIKDTEEWNLPKSLYERMQALPQEDPEEIAQVMTNVICGNYGNGEERRSRLTEAGYGYDYIQSLVNEAIYGEVPIEEFKNLVKTK